MTQKISTIRVISYILSLLYAVSAVYYIVGSSRSELQFSWLVSAMCLVLLAGSVALSLGKRWGRDLLVYGNIVFFVVGLWLLMIFPDTVILRAFDEGVFVKSVFLGTLFLAVVLCAYFTQAKIRFIINPSAQYAWKSILVVDDDEGLQKTIKQILLPKGYSVLAALNGEKGFQVAKLQKPDLIILDVILPGMKGREVCKRLKEEDSTKDIPVLFLTAKDSQDEIKAEMEIGAVAHMTKPIKARVLVNEIQRILRHT